MHLPFPDEGLIALTYCFKSRQYNLYVPFIEDAKNNTFTANLLFGCLIMHIF